MSDADPKNGSPLLEVRDLVKHFPMAGTIRGWGRGAHLRAVDGVSFKIRPHETLSLVGESGCGKTTTARMILRLDTPTSGSIRFQDIDVHGASKSELRQFRSNVQAVFQDPWGSMNPRMRVRDTIGEPLLANGAMSRRDRYEYAKQLLEIVGLDAALINSYPHELSGGMRQRVAIARAISLNPALIVLDEPVSALDVSIRAQVLNVLKDLQEKRNVAYLYIAHDLATVRFLSQRVIVMYLGQVVEEAPSEELFNNPRHPYTQALISAALPHFPGEDKDEIVLSGDVPSPTAPPPGCRFHTRCPYAFARCSEEKPLLREIADGHRVACHLHDGLSTPPRSIASDHLASVPAKAVAA